MATSAISTRRCTVTLFRQRATEPEVPVTPGTAPLPAMRASKPPLGLMVDEALADSDAIRNVWGPVLMPPLLLGMIENVLFDMYSKIRTPVSTKLVAPKCANWVVPFKK